MELGAPSEPLNLDLQTCAVAAAAVLMFTRGFRLIPAAASARRRTRGHFVQGMTSWRPFRSQIIIVRVARLNWRVRFVMLLNN